MASQGSVGSAGLDQALPRVCPVVAHVPEAIRASPTRVSAVEGQNKGSHHPRTSPALDHILAGNPPGTFSGLF